MTSLRDTLYIIAPACDLIYKNAFERLTEDLTEAFVVGKAIVGNVSCDHVAFRNPEVDWQIWIQEGDKPLPRKFVVTSKKMIQSPQFVVVLSKWESAPKITEAMFNFVPPKNHTKSTSTRCRLPAPRRSRKEKSMNTNMKLFGLGVCLMAMMLRGPRFRGPAEISFCSAKRRPLSVSRRVAALSDVTRSSARQPSPRRRQMRTPPQGEREAAADANAAAADANAAAAEANAAAAAAQEAPPRAAHAGQTPVGTIVTTLPPGCATTKLNNVEYQRCGSTYYRAQMQGSYLVYVVSQP